jgi:hypothetical protein
MRVGELALPSAGCDIELASPGKAGELPLIQENWQTDHIRSSQAQIQGFELAHPNIYLIMECMKGLVLQIQNYRISMAQDNRLSEWSPSEVHVLHSRSQRH